MSESLGIFNAMISINDHDIEVSTTIGKELKNVAYELRCDKILPPEIVAIALHLMCRDICERLKIDVDDLIHGLVDSTTEWH